MSRERLIASLSGNVAITATEFAATQVNSVYAMTRGSSPLSVAKGHMGMNEAEVPGAATRVMPLSMTLWTWSESLSLLQELQGRGVRVSVFAVIVNDLVIPPGLRDEARRRIQDALPEELRGPLDARGIEYVPRTVPTSSPRLRTTHATVPLKIAFESHLRNRARKLIDAYLRVGALRADDGNVKVLVDESRITYRAAPDFSVSPGDEVVLERNGRTPLGPAFLLAHYASHSGATSVNVADYLNRCAYRSGAVARFSLEHAGSPVHNLLYYSAAQDDCVHERFSSGDQPEPLVELSG